MLLKQISVEVDRKTVTNRGQLRIWKETVPAQVNGHEMPQVVSRRTYTAETRAHPQVGSRGIYGVQTGIGTGCFPSTSFPPVTIIPNTHLTDYDRRHIHLATDSQIT